jgi:hypothetical protein
VTTCTRDFTAPAEGSLLLIAAVIMFGLLCLLIGACAGALALWRWAPQALKPEAAEVKLLEATLPPPLPVSATASQTVQSTANEEYMLPRSKRWVTRFGQRMHTHRCSGVHGSELYPVWPCLICGEMSMSGIPTTLSQEPSRRSI